MTKEASIYLGPRDADEGDDVRGWTYLGKIDADPKEAAMGRLSEEMESMAEKADSKKAKEAMAGECSLIAKWPDGYCAIFLHVGEA